MALIKCKQCGNENAKDAKTCPKCGTKLKARPGCLMLFVGGSVGFFLLTCLIVALADEHAKTGSEQGTASSAPAAVVVAPAPAATQAAAMPADEAAFCKIVSGYAGEYKQARSDGANELRLSQLRIARRKALLATIARPAINDWVGELGELKTTGEGRAYVSVKLPCDVAIKTWNNDLSDIGDHTLIGPDSSVYAHLASMKEGSKVRVSGTLLRNALDGYHEASMSEEGSMEDPEFLLRFSAVAAQ